MDNIYMQQQWWYQHSVKQAFAYLMSQKAGDMDEETILKYSDGTQQYVKLEEETLTKAAIDAVVDKTKTLIGLYADDNIKMIEGSCFYNDSAYISLREVRFPGVEEVGEWAFAGVDGAEMQLTSIYMPKVVEVGQGAFQYNPQLKQVSLPAVKSLGTAVFQWCSGLELVDMPELEEITGVQCFNQKALGDGPDLVVNMPKLKTAGNHTFANTRVRSITLSSLEDVPSSMFSGCARLESISLASTKSLGMNAFHGCSSLKTVNIPNAVDVAEQAFWGCSQLVELLLPNAVTFGQYAFSDCSSLVALTVASLQTVGVVAFWNCSQLTHMRIMKPVDSVPGIDANAMRGIRNGKTGSVDDSDARIEVDIPASSTLADSSISSSFGWYASKIDVVRV